MDEGCGTHGSEETDLLGSTSPAGREFEKRGRYALSDGLGTLLVEQAHVGNELDQTIRTTVRITRTDTEGNVVEEGDSTWTARCLFRYEAIHLLYRCGFQVEALVGDCRNGPVAVGSQLIFQVRKRHAVAAGCRNDWERGS